MTAWDFLWFIPWIVGVMGISVVAFFVGIAGYDYARDALVARRDRRFSAGFKASEQRRDELEVLFSLPAKER